MSIVAITVLALVPAFSGTGVLSGQVLDEKGSPLAGAVVDLYTAKPRVGVALTCPSCYRDCAKSTKTDVQGQCSIGDLDPSLLFRVLVMAPGRRPILTELIDPAMTQLDVKLQPLPSDLPPGRMLKGRVLDKVGNPLAGAVVTPTGAKTNERRWWGQLPGVDEAAVTDEQGRFVITSRETKLGLDLQVSASGYAEFPPQLFDLDGQERVISMRHGATACGRLTFEGQPVKHRPIGMVQVDRSAERFIGETTLVTDDHGVFMFNALQPNENYVLYSLCDASGDLPVLKTTTLRTAGDDEVTQLNELTLVPGLALAGKVELPAGAKMPDGAKVRLSRDPAWDWCEAELSNDGEFIIRGLPPEVHRVHVVSAGFKIDTSRLRYQSTGESEFSLRLRADGEKVMHVMVPMKAK